MRIDRAFAPLLEAFDLDALDREEQSVCGVWADGRLAYTNDGWEQFAADNGAPEIHRTWPLGRNIFEAVCDDLLPFYREGWDWVATSGNTWSHTYECSSPGEFRLFRLTLYRLPHPEDGTLAGYLCIHSRLLRQAWTSDHDAATPDEAVYRNASGLIVQCAHCRRVQRTDAAAPQWDFIAQWIHMPPQATTHGLCATCSGYHYYARERLETAAAGGANRR